MVEQMRLTEIANQATELSEANKPPLNCNSILVVEDDQSIRETLQFALELEGYKVFGAENGRKALEILPHISKPCLILLDLMMPVMNGWEFSEAVKKDALLADIPVVVVSAFVDKAQTIKSKGIIKKPIDLETLFQTVKQWCGRPETAAP